MSKLNKNLLLRIYFFTGLVLVVGLSIVLSILNGAPQDYTGASRWVFSGILASAVPIILSVSNVIGLPTGMFKGHSGRSKFISVLSNGVILSMLTLAVASIIIIFLFGDATLEDYIIKNMSIGVILFPVSILLCALFNKVE